MLQNGFKSITMAGGAPDPIPIADPYETILSIADLEKAASKKLGKTAGGKSPSKFLRVLLF